MRVWLLLLLCGPVFGQYFDTVPLANKLAFVKFLQENRQVDDACYFLHHINSTEHADSLTLMEIRLLLQLRREKTADSLLRPFLMDAKGQPQPVCSAALFRNHIRLMDGRSDSLTEPLCTHKQHQEVWRVHVLAGLLLKGSFEEFDMVFNSARNTDPDLVLVEFALHIQKEEARRRPKKSHFLAGLMSAVLPGAGKLYAGKPHEAVNAFLPVIFNGAQAAEGYYFRQLQSPNFYVFGVIGSVFYVSNIYGSARAAKRANEEFSYKIKSGIDFEIIKLIKYY